MATYKGDSDFEIALHQNPKVNFSEITIQRSDTLDTESLNSYSSENSISTEIGTREIHSPIIEEPHSTHTHNRELDPYRILGSFDSRADSSLDKLSDTNRFVFKHSGRVDKGNFQIIIENENGRNIYSVRIESVSILANIFDKRKHQAPGKDADAEGTIISHQNLQKVKSTNYIFMDILTGEVVMLVSGENGTMIVRSKNDNLIGIVQENKWYRRPNFTASSPTGRSSFLIQSSQGYLALTWFSYCTHEAEFRISSSGIETGTINRIHNRTNETPNLTQSVNTTQVSVNFTNNLDVNSKGLLLAASVMVFVSHFGETGCSGSTGVRGAFCCSGFA